MTEMPEEKDKLDFPTLVMHAGITVFGLAAWLTGEWAADYKTVAHPGFELHRFLGIGLSLFILARLLYGIWGPEQVRWNNVIPLDLKAWLGTIQEDAQSLLRQELPDRPRFWGLKGLVQLFGLLVFSWMALTGSLLAKSDGVIANAHGPGQGEALATEGYLWPGQAYCLAVYKTGTTDLYKTGTYNLRMAPGVTGLPDSPPAPARTVLLGASPNPFNPRTAIRYELAREAKVRLAIHDAAGRRVRVLDEGRLPAGPHAADWDGRSDAGAVVPSGVYFCRLEAGECRQTVKLTLLR